MVNVGLRAFIWENKDIEHKLAREASPGCAQQLHLGHSATHSCVAGLDLEWHQLLGVSGVCRTLQGPWLP